MQDQEMARTSLRLSKWLTYALVAVSFVLYSHRLVANDEAHWREPRSCGVASCYSFLRLLGVDTTYESVRLRIAITEAGSNFQDLNDACESIGICVSIISGGPEILLECSLPAVALVYPESAPGTTGFGGAHYVVIVAANENTVTYLDPTAVRTFQLPRADFIRGWSGYVLVRANTSQLSQILLQALLVAQVIYLLRPWIRAVAVTAMICIPAVLGGLIGCSRAEKSASGPQPSNSIGSLSPIAYESAEKRTVPLAPDAAGSVVFTLKNVSSRPVTLETGQPTCACTSFDLQHRTLQPGESGTLSMTLRNTGQFGMALASINVATGDNCWTEIFTVRGSCLGLQINNNILKVNRTMQNTLSHISGSVLTRYSGTAITLQIDSLGEKDFVEVVRHLSPEVTVAIPEGDCFEHTFRLPVSIGTFPRNWDSSGLVGRFLVTVSSDEYNASSVAEVWLTVP